MVKSLLKKIAAFPSAETYDQAKAYSLMRGLRPQFDAAKRLPSREAVWDEAIARLGPDEPILYLEFGVYQGYSIKYFSERLRHPDTRFYGFDSFEGLPERWGDISKGTFTTAGSMPAISDPRVSFVKGWFQNTLPGFLATPGILDPARGSPKHVFVHLDADLYSSTLFVMAMLWRHLPGYYFCFDEFMGHELRALTDFTQAFPAEVSVYAYDVIANYPGRMFGSIKHSMPASSDAA